MKQLGLDEYLASVRKAPYQSKRDWILERVKGKKVLDLGVVDHCIEVSEDTPDKWLHGLVVESAESTLGVDLLEDEVKQLQRRGYDVIVGNALELRLDEKFDVVVCGDLIEHVTDLKALLDTIDHHLSADGIGLITTPNPFSINRFFNIIADGHTGINREHTCWICPQTMFQLVERSELAVKDFSWLKTDFPGWTKRRFWGRILNSVALALVVKRQLLRTDFGVVLRKQAISSNPILESAGDAVSRPATDQVEAMLSDVDKSLLTN